MSAAQHPGYHSIDLSSPGGKGSLEGKSPFDVTDDLDRATSLSHTSRMPLNGNNPAQSTTSIPPQHDVQYTDLSKSPADAEGPPPQVSFDSHTQNQQHTPSTRNSSWDLLGGARKFGEAYEQFDSRNASEQHLAFADGDLPKTKVKLSTRIGVYAGAGGTHNMSVCPLLSISSERVNRDAMDIVHYSCHAHHLDPRNSRRYSVPERTGSSLSSIRATGS
jgi:hypothetical protein